MWKGGNEREMLYSQIKQLLLDKSELEEANFQLRKASFTSFYLYLGK